MNMAARGKLCAGFIGLAAFHAPAQVRPTSPPVGMELHVAIAGSDQAAGSAAHPFASLERVRDEVRAMRKAGVLPEGGVTITLHAGEHPLPRTVQLRNDSPALKPVEAGGVGFERIPFEQIGLRTPRKPAQIDTDANRSARVVFKRSDACWARSVAARVHPNLTAERTTRARRASTTGH